MGKRSFAQMHGYSHDMPGTGSPGDPRVYMRIAAQLRGRIEAGELASGQPMPSITTLSQEWECSRPTVAKAFGQLEADGLIHRVPGLGYYVR
jgi:DNA-binding GntR family transcriptional regulator